MATFNITLPPYLFRDVDESVSGQLRECAKRDDHEVLGGVRGQHLDAGGPHRGRRLRVVVHVLRRGEGHSYLQNIKVITLISNIIHPFITNFTMADTWKMGISLSFMSSGVA